MESKKKKIKSGDIVIAGMLLLIVAVVLVIVFLMNGTTTTTGEFPESEVTNSMICTSSDVDYPFFATNDAAKKSMEIRLVENDDKISTVSLTYILTYGSEGETIESRDRNHFAVNKAFDDDGMEADSLGATYSIIDKNNFKFNLFAESGDLNGLTLKYFLLGDMAGKGGNNYSTAQNLYKEQGFKCKGD